MRRLRHRFELGFRNQRIGDDSTAHEVFLDDPFEDRRIAGTVPCAFRIDDRDRPAFADAQTVGFRSKDAALFRETQLLEPPLEKIPRRKSAFLVAAFRCCLIATQEDVPSRDVHADRRRNSPL